MIFIKDRHLERSGFTSEGVAEGNMIFIKDRHHLLNSSHILSH